ncbi:MAG: hypothetical protein Q9223_004382 [Gallowayella weberi]
MVTEDDDFQRVLWGWNTIFSGILQQEDQGSCLESFVTCPSWLILPPKLGRLNRWNYCMQDKVPAELGSPNDLPHAAASVSNLAEEAPFSEEIYSEVRLLYYYSAPFSLSSLHTSEFILHGVVPAMSSTTLPRQACSWPAKPGLELIPESRLDNRPEQDILASLQEYHPVTSERNIWAFWHSGISNSPGWTQRTVVNWVRRFPTWQVRVLDSVPGSPLHFHRYLTPTLLPDALNNNAMTGVHAYTHSSDLVRLALVYVHGGVWMDVGSLPFRDLDNMCWGKIEDPDSPYELAGFLVPYRDGTPRASFINGFIAAKKGNPFIKRWHEIFLEVWKGATESKGMHTHPLLKRDDNFLDDATLNQERSPSRQDTEPEQPWQKAHEPEKRQAMADYTIQFACFDRLSRLEDPSDGFNGHDYLATHALLFDSLHELFLAHQLTAWNGIQQLQYLATKKQEGSSDLSYLAAESFAERIVRDSCMMKVSHYSKLLDMPMLGNLWEEPGNEDADCAEGTFAAYLRYASVHFEQTRELKPQKWEPSGRRMRVGLLEVDDEG